MFSGWQPLPTRNNHKTNIANTKVNGQKSKEGGRNVEIPQTKVNGKVSEHKNDTFFDIGYQNLLLISF